MLNSYVKPINISIYPTKVQTFHSIPEETSQNRNDLGNLQLEEEDIEDQLDDTHWLTISPHEHRNGVHRR